MKKRCPVKTQLNKLYRTSTKFSDLGFHLSYDRPTKTVYNHDYQSSIAFALEKALKPLVLKDNLEPLIILIMNEIRQEFHSAEMVEKQESVLKDTSLTFSSFLVLNKRLYDSSMSELMSKYKKVSLKQMKDNILKVVYTCLLVHLPYYKEEYLNVE